MALKARYVGAERVQKARLLTLKSEFEKLKMAENEIVDQFAGKITSMVLKATGLGYVFEQDVLVKKLLDAVPDKYFNLVASIEQTVDLDNMRFEDAVGRLKTFEECLRGRERASESQNRGRGGPSSLECGRGRETGGQGSYQTEGRVRERKDRSQIKCFQCDKMGPLASSCPEQRRANQEANLAETKEQANSDPASYLNLHETVYLNEERVNPKRLEAEKVEEGTWYLDNGALNHMTGNR
ncbi:uncharacterized protein LOC143570841 [Bidens hawaiensis]|uniref:uncharacterized protein LOC143570841 n=1 Tax=Bidens hawaiensis TaxID=980011 RepID=UPI00404A68C8